MYYADTVFSVHLFFFIAVDSYNFAFNLLQIDDILAYVYPYLPLSGKGYLTFQRLESMI